MKSKMRKKLIAFMLCMVLVICNSVSILADAPAAATTATEKQVKETGTAKSEGASEEEKSADDEKDTSEQSDEESAPETETTEKKEETTEATTEDKEDATTEATTEAEEGTSEAAESSDKEERTGAEDDSDKKDEATEASEDETAGTSEETTETTEEASTEKTEETTVKSETQVAFELTYEAEDAVIDVTAAEGVFPEGTTFTAEKVEFNTDKYNSVEKSLEKEAAKTDKDVLDFIAYDLTFFDKERNEIEPNGEVQVSFTFKDVTLGGASDEKSTTDVVHIKDDNKTETVKSEINIKNEQLKKVEFVADEFSIYAVTATGIAEQYTSKIEADDYAVIEFWDKNITEGNQSIEFEKFYGSNYEQNNRYLRIQVYVNNSERVKETFRLDMTGYEYANVNLQTTVRPGNEYYLAKECQWQKAGSGEVSTFGGSGSTGMNTANDTPKVNTLTIYLTTQNPNNSCSGEINDTTKNISVDLYNYDTEAYNNAVGLNNGSLLLRSAWGNYKADGYNVSGNNAHNESCGKTGIYYGLAQSSLNDGNIVFNKTAKFFDNQFNTSVGTKYSNVDFEFIYDEVTGEYKYNSEENHVHFDEATNTISQYSGAGPNTLSDSSDLTKSGFFPFTDENDNMTDYGFGMRMDVEFQLTENGTINGSTPMKFSFSGDDDVWVFIDGELALDLGGLHSRRGGTINFKDKNVTYDQVTYKEGDSSITADATPVDGTEDSKPDTSFLEDLGEGTHTLTMYYLERGGDASNCEIKFNLLVINREGTLEFDKVDSEGKSLSGAEFGLYDTNNITDETEPIETAESGVDGKVVFDISGLDVTKKYYLKEISAPFGYITDSKVYKVSVVENKENPQNIIVTGAIDGLTETDGKVINQKYTSTGGTTEVTVTKEWEDGLTPTPVSVSLWANGEKLSGPEYTVTLDSNNDWTKTWSNLPGDTVYEVKENDIPNGIEVTTDEKVEYTLAGEPYRIKPCNILSYTMSDNAVVIIFSGSQYHVWTPVEVSDKNSSFYGVLNKIKGNSGPSISSSNTQFYTGQDVNAGFENEEDIHFTYNLETREINVDYVASNAWSWFCIGNYNKKAEITLTNGIDEGATINIPVEKKWMGDPQFTQYRGYVTVQLYQNNQEYGEPVQIKKDDGWIYTFLNLPYYDSTNTPYNYTIEEINIDGDPIEESSWEIDISGSAQEGFVITNIWLPHWYIQKIDSVTENPLGKAKFTLTPRGSSEPSYYGISDATIGYIIWWDNQQDMNDYNINKRIKYIPDGTYILEEIEAPEGYLESSITWEITIENLEFLTIKDEAGNPVYPVGIKTRGKVESMIYQFKNTPYYELPSAGGPGIYWYTLGGTLLMAGAALIVYRQKRKREVLLRK